MKTILCFGDSNTWGFDPATKERYAPYARWPGVLRPKLGAGWQVIEEGLNGRTTVFEDPIMPGRSGIAYLAPCLESHRPLDWVIIAVGVNDLKQRFSATPSDIARGAGLLLETVQKSACGRGGGIPRILLVAPAPLGKLTEFADQFEGGAEKSLALAECYKSIAAERGCEFFNAAAVAKASDIDGVHYSVEDHKKLGEGIAARIMELDG